MLRRLLMRVSARLPAREIFRAGGAPYLERYYIGRFLGWTFYLHRFLDGDEGTALHDHPWRLSISLVLSGRYREYRVDHISRDDVHLRSRVLRPGFLNFIYGADFHRVELPAGQTEVWTLFAAGRRCRRWGFLNWRRPHSTQLGLELWFTYVPASDPHAQDREWHHTAPTGAQLRDQQLCRDLHRAQQQIRDGFRAMKVKRDGETAA